MAASAQLTHFKKVYKKIYSKEYHFMEQSLHELKSEEVAVAKTGSILTEVETADTLVVESLPLTAHLSLLTDPFFFYFSFFQLPDLLFYNIL